MLPMRDAYGMSVVLSAFMATRRLTDGSIGEVIDLPNEVLKLLAIILIKEGCEMWTIPNSQFLVI